MTRAFRQECPIAVAGYRTLLAGYRRRLALSTTGPGQPVGRASISLSISVWAMPAVPDAESTRAIASSRWGWRRLAAATPPSQPARMKALRTLLKISAGA